MIKYISIFWLVLRCLLVARKFDRVFNRLDLPVEESRPNRQPDRPVDPTGAGRPDRFPSLICIIFLPFITA